MLASCISGVIQNTISLEAHQESSEGWCISALERLDDMIEKCSTVIIYVLGNALYIGSWENLRRKNQINSQNQIIANRGIYDNMTSIAIRNEEEAEWRVVEELTRDSFWNYFQPGADEHFLLHKLREHPDFIKELDFVATVI